jgi:hypothetical protein
MAKTGFPGSELAAITTGIVPARMPRKICRHAEPHLGPQLRQRPPAPLIIDQAGDVLGEDKLPGIGRRDRTGWTTRLLQPVQQHL